MMRIFLAALVGFAITFSGGTSVLACTTFVGGVCLDKKKAPAKKPVKKSTPKKKKVVPKKKVVAPEPKVVQPAKPTKAAANSCVKLLAGKASSMDFYKDVVYTNVTVRNTCKERISVSLQLNACKSPRAYFAPNIGSARKKFKLRSGGSVSYRIAHQEGLRGAAALARTNAAYDGQKAPYPRFGC